MSSVSEFAGIDLSVNTVNRTVRSYAPRAVRGTRVARFALAA